MATLFIQGHLKNLAKSLDSIKVNHFGDGGETKSTYIIVDAYYGKKGWTSHKLLNIKGYLVDKLNDFKDGDLVNITAEWNVYKAKDSNEYKETWDVSNIFKMNNTEDLDIKEEPKVKGMSKEEQRKMFDDKTNEELKLLDEGIDWD